MTALYRPHFRSILFVTICLVNVCPFLAVSADRTSEKRFEYHELLVTEKSRIAERLITADPHVNSQVNAVLSLLESTDFPHFYSLACLSKAAESLNRSDWEHSMAMHLVDHARRTADSHTSLDAAYSEYEEYVQFLFGSREAGWDSFCKLVAVLEWGVHSVENRDELTDIYVRLLRTRDVDVDYVELHSAVNVFVDLVKWLSPRATPFRSDAFKPAILRARDIVFRI